MNIRINFTSPETIGIFLPDAETRTILSILSSFVWTQYRNVTDRSGLARTVVCTASNADGRAVIREGVGKISIPVVEALPTTRLRKYI